MLGRLLLTLGLVPLASHARNVSILLAMIARNEEDNFAANLPKWAPIIDGIIVGIDDRTTDGTALAVVTALPDLPRWLYYYHFEGFGPARTRVFQEAWRKFSDMSHIMVADPDWEPAANFPYAELDFSHVAFMFKIWDRNSHTTRLSEWLVLHRQGLEFDYRLHEQLRVPGDPSLMPSKQLAWEVREVEVAGRASWHTEANHGHSQSFNRYLFDLELLERDRNDMPDDPHVLYYLGATNFAALEALLGRGDHAITPEVTGWIEKGTKYLEQRLAAHHVANPKINQEQTWAAMRWLAYSYQHFAFNFEKSEYWYTRCIALDPLRADCPVFLAKLYRQNRQVDDAWEIIAAAVKSPLQERGFSNNFYIHQCSLPLEAAMTLIELLATEGSVQPSRLSTFLFGWRLLRSAQSACNSESLGFLLESAEDVAAAEAAYRALAPKGGENGESALSIFDRGELCIDTDDTVDAEHVKMLRDWGVSFCQDQYGAL